jgi:hypothetical protein
MVAIACENDASDVIADWSGCVDVRSRLQTYGNRVFLLAHTQAACALEVLLGQEGCREVGSHIRVPALGTEASVAVLQVDIVVADMVPADLGLAGLALRSSRHEGDSWRLSSDAGVCLELVALAHSCLDRMLPWRASEMEESCACLLVRSPPIYISSSVGSGFVAVSLCARLSGEGGL